MFRKQWWLFGKTISGEGFSVGFIERGKLLYELGDKRMVVRVEGNWPDLDLFHGTMAAWENDDSPIDGVADELNVRNVTRALEWRRFVVRVIPRGTGW